MLSGIYDSFGVTQVLSSSVHSTDNFAINR